MTIIEALRDALQDPNPAISQERVHHIVARRLEDLTERTTVRTTGYFNHSWAPDFVVGTGEQPERGVFLRFGVRDASFADDLKYLAGDGPMFLDLEAAPQTHLGVHFVARMHTQMRRPSARSGRATGGALTK